VLYGKLAALLKEVQGWNAVMQRAALMLLKNFSINAGHDRVQINHDERCCIYSYLDIDREVWFEY